MFLSSSHYSSSPQGRPEQWVPVRSYDMGRWWFGWWSIGRKKMKENEEEESQEGNNDNGCEWQTGTPLLLIRRGGVAAPSTKLEMTLGKRNWSFHKSKSAYLPATSAHSTMTKKINIQVNLFNTINVWILTLMDDGGIWMINKHPIPSPHS